MKTAIKLILLVGIAGYLVFAVSQFAQQTEEIVCEGVSIEISDSLQNVFITENDIQKILTKHKFSPKGLKLSDINIKQIEEVLQNNPYINEVQCFFTGQGLLRIKVVPQQPILHIISANGEDYYLNSTGDAMPIGEINIDLCIATGHISKKFAKESLLPLAQYILNQKFWNQLTEQIHVTETMNIEIAPRVGEHIIQLGCIDNFKEKLQRVEYFYKHGLPKVGWNKYKTINAAFKDQIVCTKKAKK